MYASARGLLAMTEIIRSGDGFILSSRAPPSPRLRSTGCREISGCKMGLSLGVVLRFLDATTL
jgi:hypothetical protein